MRPLAYFSLALVILIGVTGVVALRDTPTGAHHSPVLDYAGPIDSEALASFGTPAQIREPGDKFIKYTDSKGVSYRDHYRELLAYLNSPSARERAAATHEKYWSHSYPDKAAFLKGMEGKRADLAYALGLGDVPNAQPQTIDQTVVVREPKFTVFHSRIHTRDPGIVFDFYKAVPVGRPVKGVVVGFHGYTSIPEKSLGLKGLAEDYTRSFAKHFAENGYVVYVPYVLSEGNLNSYVSAMGMLYTGYTNLGIDVLKGMTLIDVAKAGEWAHLPIITYGISNGGLLAALLGALDLRVDVTVSSGMIMDMASYFAKRYVNLTQSSPRTNYVIHNGPWLRNFHFSDFAKLIYPRPLIIELGSYDFRVAEHYGPEEQWRQISQTYGMFNGADEGNVKLIWFQGHHEFASQLVIPAVDELATRWRLENEAN